MVVLDRERKTLAKFGGPNRLYILNVGHARPECPLARAGQQPWLDTLTSMHYEWCKGWLT
jgi:hypothetical protein